MATEKLGLNIKDDPGLVMEDTEESTGDVSADDTISADAPVEVPAATGGLSVERLYSNPGHDPYDGVEWEKRTATIAGDGGEVVFEQKDVEIPADWSQLATNVVVSKYFRGPLGTPKRENSVKHMIDRVADTIAGWGRAQGYLPRRRTPTPSTTN